MAGLWVWTKPHVIFMLGYTMMAGVFMEMFFS